MTAIPDITAYLDYRAYLRDWFEARKAANPRFSHRAFVRRVGQKSPSLLSDVIARRRNLTPELTAAFATAMKLDDEDQRFFADLVALDQATSADERNEAFTRIAATRRFREARQVEGDSFRYVAEWYYPAIRELAAREDFVDDPAWVARQLHPNITAAKARVALQALKDLGMLVEEGGRWVQAEGAVVTRTDLDALLDRGPAYALGQVRVKASKAGGKFRGFEIVSLTPQAQSAVASQLQVGDVITHLNGVRLQKPGDYMDAWKGLKKVRAIRIDYLRKDQAQSARWNVQDAP